MSDTFDSTRDARVAVVTGHHPFDVPHFQDAFRSMPGVLAYPQDLCEFSSDVARLRDDYAAVVFYMMPLQTPGSETEWWDRGIRGALDRLGETEQGIVVLHHALLAYRDWDRWHGLIGLDNRTYKSYHPGEQVTSQIADSSHPITRGLESWTMTDETYVMGDAGPDSHVLVTYDHPRSMHTIAWTRALGKARVFCYAAGHDRLTYADPNFRELLRRGILWAAHREDSI